MTALYNEIEPFAVEWLKNLERAGHIAPGHVEARSIVDLQHWVLSSYLLDAVFSDLEGAGYSGVGHEEDSLPDVRGTDARSAQIRRCANNEPWRLQLRSRKPRREDLEARRRGKTRWVADASGRRLEARHLLGASEAPAGEGQRSLGAHVVGALGELGDADRFSGGQGRSHSGGRAGRGVAESRPGFKRAGDADELGDAAVARLEGEQHRGADGDARLEGSPSERAGAADAGTVGDAGLYRVGELARVVPRDESEHEERGAFGDHSPILAGATRGFWADADWLYCIDGKYRPVGPGSFPLAHGAASRVGRLRAYGNAINAQVAKTFIQAVMETLE